MLQLFKVICGLLKDFLDVGISYLLVLGFANQLPPLNEAFKLCAPWVLLVQAFIHVIFPLPFSRDGCLLQPVSFKVPLFNWLQLLMRSGLNHWCVTPRRRWYGKRELVPKLVLQRLSRVYIRVCIRSWSPWHISRARHTFLRIIYVFIWRFFSFMTFILSRRQNISRIKDWP